MNALSVGTLVLYACVSLLYVGTLLRPAERLVKVARWAMVGALVVHLASIGSYCVRGMHPLRDAGGALSLIAWLLVLGYLLTGMRWRLGVAGAIISPLAFILVLSADLTPRAPVAVAAADVGLTMVLGKAHLTLVAGGVACFALAAALALLYLVQDAALRAGRFGVLYRRMPALAALDKATWRLVEIGFPLFTLAVVTGLLWMSRLPESHRFRLEYAVAIVSWTIYGALILIRTTRGISGRRAAILALSGFAATVLVLGLYVSRRFGGG